MGAGKVLGAMLGLMAGLLIGGPWAIVLALILGTALGHYFDEQHGAQRNWGNAQGLPGGAQP
ncbi:hypothetical protein D7Y27_40025, partial [Corallococcus sp. AB004]